MNYFFKYKAFLPICAFLLSLSVPTIVTADGTGSVSSIDTLQNPLGNISSFPQLLAKLLDAAITLGIPVAVLFIVWAGFRFILARGNPGELEKARENFLWTIVGIGIFLGASLIAKVLENTVSALNS